MLGSVSVLARRDFTESGATYYRSSSYFQNELEMGSIESGTLKRVKDAQSWVSYYTNVEIVLSIQTRTISSSSVESFLSTNSTFISESM